MTKIMTSESSSSSSSDDDSSVEEEPRKETMMQVDSDDEEPQENNENAASEEADDSSSNGEDDDDEENEPSSKNPASITPTLSKSWAVHSRHIPLFTGGKITHCYAQGLTASSPSDKTEDDEEEEVHHPFVILPVGGDLALVDSHRGITLGTVRGIAGTTEATEDEDVEVDMDAITTYALSYNDKILMTCSHNTVIRQYAVEQKMASPSSSGDETNNTQDAAVVSLTKTWGKSGHTLPITHMEFHASNVFLATGSVDGTARIWDVRGGYVSHVFRPYQSNDGGGSGRLSVTALEWMPDIQHLSVAIGRDDGSIAIHDLRQDKQVTLLHEHVSSVVSMQWPLPLEEQQLFITSGRDSVVNVWKIDTSSSRSMKKNKKKKHHDNGYRKIQTLPVYESVEGLIALPPRPGRKDVVIALAGAKGRVRSFLYNTSSNQLELQAEQPVDESFGEERGGYMRLAYWGSRKPVYSVEHAKEECLIVADAEHNIQFLSLSTKKETPLFSTRRTIVGHNDDILDIKVLPSGKKKPRNIAVATNSSQVRIFDLNTFSCHVLDGHSKTVLCVDVSPCGNFLATCGKDKEMRIWHIPSLSCCAVGMGHAEAIGSTALSRLQKRYGVHGKAATNGGGAFAVTVSVDRTLKRWNLPGTNALEEAAEEGNELSLHSLASARAHEKDINVVSVAPNDSFVATGSQDKTIKIWNAADLTLRATLVGHRRGVWDCQFSPFDRVLASASGDTTVKLWSLGDFSCVRTFQGHLSSVLRVRFLSYGMQLASSGADGLVKVWTIRTNECETTLDGHNGRAWALDLSSDGKSMISGGADSRILVWEDITQQEETAEHAKREEALMLDQKLANHIRHKEYSKALDITLQLDKPYQALKVFTAIIESNVEGGKDGIEPLRVLARGWSDEKMTRVLQYCREWNTRARNCHVALLVVRAVVSTVPVHDLARMEGVPEIMAGIMPYAERHFERLDRLFESSFLIDFTLASMGSIGENDSDDFNTWEASSKLVLPPVSADGRVQIGGKDVIGSLSKINGEIDDDEVLTIGESSDDDSISSDNSSASSNFSGS